MGCLENTFICQIHSDTTFLIARLFYAACQSCSPGSGRSRSISLIGIEIGLAQAYQIDVDDAVVDADDFMAVGSIDRSIDTQTYSV